MPHFACIGVQADQQPLTAIPIRAATPKLAEEMARRLLNRVPGVEAVEVYQGVQLVARMVQSDEVVG